VVTLHGRDHYPGPHGTDESKAEYDRLIAEYLVRGRHAPPAPGASDESQSSDDLTLNEVFARYWDGHVIHYYRKHSRPTSEQSNIRKAVRPLLELYGQTLASRFGPLALKAYRQRLIDMGRARPAINRDVDRVRRMLKWAGENELVSAQIYQNLRAVAGLKRGRSEALEPEPIQPVPEDTVEAVLKHVSPQVAAMIRLQMLTGMQPGEVVIMRGCDLDTGSKP